MAEVDNKKAAKPERVENKTKEAVPDKKVAEPKPEKKRVKVDVPLRAQKQKVIKDWGVTVVDYLTPDEKLQVASTAVDAIVIVDDDIGVPVDVAYRDDLIELALLEAYTDIEVPLESPLDFLYSVRELKGYNEAVSFFEGDAAYTKKYIELLAIAAKNVYRATNSMDYFVRQMSSASNEGEDLLRLIENNAGKVSDVAGAIANEKDKAAALPNNMITFNKRRN